MSRKSSQQWDRELTCLEKTCYNTKLQILAVLLMCAVIGVVTPIIWHTIWKVQFNSCKIESDLRFECLPHLKRIEQNETLCTKANCCWDNYSSIDYIKCYYGIEPQTKLPGYKVESSSELSAVLLIDQTPTFLGINSTIKELKHLPPPIPSKNLKIDVQYYNKDHFRVKISSLDNPTVFDPIKYLKLMAPSEKGSKESDVIINWPKQKDEKFFLKIKRKNAEHFIFNTEHSPFVFCDRYIEITTLLPNDLTYGLGQHQTSSFKHHLSVPQNWAIFSKNSSSNNKNWYGSHPFYLGLDGDGKAYGVLLLNTNPISIVTNSRPSIQFRTIGGPLDFHFFMGPKPDQVIKQYTEFIGRPVLPPYWALGFHLCRSTCNVSEAQRVYTNLTEEYIPFESDCGSSLMSLTTFNDNTSFTRLNELAKQSGRTMFVHIPQIYIPQIYHENMPHFSLNYMSEALRGRQYLKNENGISDYVGNYHYVKGCNEMVKVGVAFPDFRSDSFKNYSYLKEELKVLSKDTMDIDGMILDLNTPFDLKYYYEGNKSYKSDIYNYPYVSFGDDPIFSNTTCMNLIHPSTKDNNIRHINLHNLYGLEHSIAIHEALKNKSGNNNNIHNRKLVLSLSTFPGSGTIGGHWGGHINASWDMLRQTIIQALEFNLYGIPLVGFPVCGSMGSPPDDELCMRWYQVAAFQPFMLSYRDFNETFTDPKNMAGITNAGSFNGIRSVISLRYSLLPYLYTLFYKANLYGEMVMRPLFVEFPDDSKTYRIDQQFLWGSALLISPVTNYDTKSLKAYFPQGYWYDFYTGKRFVGKSNTIELSAIEYHINLHIRGGYVIPTQENDVNNTKIARKSNFNFIAALDEKYSATGQLFIDDGETTPNSGVIDNYILTNITVTSNNITMETHINNPKLVDNLKNYVSPTVDTIRIYGIIDKPNVIKMNINNNPHPREIDDNDAPYFANYGVLTINGLNLTLLEDKKVFIQWVSTYHSES